MLPALIIMTATVWITFSVIRAAVAFMLTITSITAAIAFGFSITSSVTTTISFIAFMATAIAVTA